MPDGAQPVNGIDGCLASPHIGTSTRDFKDVANCLSPADQPPAHRAEHARQRQRVRHRLPASQPQRPNPSIESTKADDALDRAMHEGATGMGAAAGAGLGCLGVAFAPWVAAFGAVAVGILFIVIMKGCGG